MSSFKEIIRQIGTNVQNVRLSDTVGWSDHAWKIVLSEFRFPVPSISLVPCSGREVDSGDTDPSNSPDR